MKKEWHILYINNQNKPKMVGFKKIKFPFVLEFNFNGGQFYKKNIRFRLFQKVGKIHNKIVKLEIPNFELLRRTKEGRVNEDRISHVRSIG